MVLRKRTSNGWLRMMLFFIVFGLAMTITFAEVEGIDLYKGEPGQQPTGDGNSVGAEAAATASETPLTAVPEPATMILMGLGLSAAYIMRKRRTD